MSTAPVRQSARYAHVFVAVLCLWLSLVARGQDEIPLYYSIKDGICDTYSADGRWYAFGLSDVYLFEAQSQAFRGVLNPGGNDVKGLDFSADGKLLAVLYTHWDPPAEESNVAHDIAILSVPEGKELIRFRALDNYFLSGLRIRFNPDASRVAMSNEEGITVYNTATGQVTWTYSPDWELHRRETFAAFDVTPDWRYFLYNLERIPYPEGPPDRMARWGKNVPLFHDSLITADGTRAVAMGDQNGVVKRLYDLRSGEVLKTCPDDSECGTLTLTPDGNRVLLDHVVWNLETDEISKLPNERALYAPYAPSPDGVRFSRNGRCYDLTTTPATRSFWLGGGKAPAPSCFDLSTGRLGEDVVIPQITPYAGTRYESIPRNDKRFPGGQLNGYAKYANEAGTLGVDSYGRLLYLKTSGKEPLPITAEGLGPVAFFLDDDTVLLVWYTGLCRYVVSTGERKDHALAIPSGLAMGRYQPSGDAKWLLRVSGNNDTIEKRLVEVYDTATLTLVLQLWKSPAGGGVFSADSKQLAIWSGRKATVYTCGKWDAEPLTITVPTGRLTNASFSPDNSLLALGINDGVTRIYDLPTGRLRYYVMGESPTGLRNVLYDRTGKPVRAR